MTGPELRRLWQQLAEASAHPAGASFSAIQLGKPSAHMIALSPRGAPALLINTVVDDAAPAAIRLSGLSASFGVRCALSIDGSNPEDRIISIVECTAALEARPIFSEFVGTLLRLLGTSPTMIETAAAVLRFAAIFNSLTIPSRQSITGLIGELMILSVASDPSTAVLSWRSNPLDHFDFVAPDARVECKASGMGLRMHSLSWEQCNPPDGPALAASVFVESAGGGLSLRELIERIEGRMSMAPDAAIRLRETVAATMGASLQRSLEVRFDESVARNSLQWYDLRQVPGIRGDLPGGVSTVRFMSNFASASVTSLSSLEGTGLASLIPMS